MPSASEPSAFGRLQASVPIDVVARLLRVDVHDVFDLAKNGELALVPVDGTFRIERSSAVNALSHRLSRLSRQSRTEDPNLHVLVVDDDDLTGRYHELLIEQHFPGSLVTVVDGPDEAVRLLKDIRPDVVISDLNMPVDGYRLLWWLYLRPEFARVTTIAYSALEPRNVEQAGGLPPFVELVPKGRGVARLLQILRAAQCVEAACRSQPP